MGDSDQPLALQRGTPQFCLSRRCHPDRQRLTDIQYLPSVKEKALRLMSDIETFFY